MSPSTGSSQHASLHASQSGFSLRALGSQHSLSEIRVVPPRLLALTFTALAWLAPATTLRAETPRLQQEFHYSLYLELASAYDASLAGLALLDRVVARTPQGLRIRFPPGSEARAAVHLSSGVLRYVADDKDELRLPDKREWRRDNPRIVLSVQPLEVALDF